MLATYPGDEEERRPIVIVSHSMSNIVDFCDRAIWVKTGTLCGTGPIIEVAKVYMAFVNETFYQYRSLLEVDESRPEFWC